MQDTLVFGVLQAVGPQAGGLRVGLDQSDLRFVAPGQGEVIDGLPIDEEHRRGRAVFRCHVGDGRAIPQRERRRALAAELQVRAHDLLLAQELGQRQHHVGGGDARLRAPGQLDTDDVGQAHP